jgi:hypothetical protein
VTVIPEVLPAGSAVSVNGQLRPCGPFSIRLTV